MARVEKRSPFRRLQSRHRPDTTMSLFKVIQGRPRLTPSQFKAVDVKFLAICKGDSELNLLCF